MKKILYIIMSLAIIGSSVMPGSLADKVKDSSIVSAVGEYKVYTDEETGFEYMVPLSNEATIVGYTGDKKTLEIPSEIGRYKYKVKSIGSSAFYGNEELTEVTIPDGVRKIEANAFKHCLNLTKVDIPDSVYLIEHDAFYGCKSLTEIIIPDSVTLIEEKAFFTCTSLTKVTLSKNLKEIRMYAFSECSNLAEIIIPESVEVVGYSVFNNCESLTKMVIYNKDVEFDSFGNCPNLTIYGYKDSTAETVVAKYGWPTPYFFIPLDDKLNGDVNGDGSVSAIDLVTLMKYLLGDTSGIDKYYADVDNDGSVDILDLIRLKGIVLEYWEVIALW